MKSALRSSTILTAVLLSVPALAQTTGGLEEIVVTAQRREESLQTVPVAVTAISSEALHQHQITDSQDLQRFVPSLKMTNNVTTPNNLSPSLRGSTIQDASLATAEGPFGIYVDDVYISRLNGNNAQLADVERVEVLRGPQGTLYGRNTLAGAIKFVSKNPGRDPWLNFSAGYGNWNQYRVSFSGGAPINENWSASLAAQGNGKGGEFKNLATGKDVGSEDNVAVRGKLRYTSNDGFDAIATVSYTKSTNDSLQQVPATPGSRLPTGQFTSDSLVPTYGFYTINRADVAARSPAFVSAQPNARDEQLLASLTMTYDLGGATLKSITAFVNTKDYFTTDFGGVGAIMSGIDTHSDEFTQELQIQGKAADDRLDYLAGVYYLHENAKQDFGWQFITPTSVSDEKSRTNSISVFGQASYKITDAFKATAGVRYVHDSKYFNFYITHLPTSIVPGNSGHVLLRNGYSAATPKFGLDYTIPTSGAIDSMLIYASAARGFKSGGYNGIAIFDVNEGALPYAPETNWSYEGGIKTDMFNKRLRVNAAYFVNMINNVVFNTTVNLPGGGSVFPNLNSANQTVQGLELETAVVPVDNLTIFGNAAFESGHYRKILAGSGAATAAALYGSATPPQVPKYSFTVGFDYGIDVPLGGKDGRINIGMDWYRTGKYFVSVANDFIISPYSRVDGYVALTIDSKWEARLAVKNLQDKHTFNSGSLSLGGFIIQPPREVMGTISYKM
jgi:iron complex outermembrane receptor protein